ncbi:MAG: long-chain fatty acid--CoA ligase [Candidatus Komeilibacteria bacterium]|nr:long-chain fatty acid--CoA ligase [Candidatus Komeilibacteria bacterium]
MSENQTIFNKFEQAVKKYPKNIALGYKHHSHFKTLSYGRLLDKVNRAVTGLKKLGVKPGDRVAIFSRNRPEWVKLDLALNKIGAVCVPIHTTLSPRLIKHIIQNSGARFLAIGDLFSKYQEIADQLQLASVITFNRIEWKQGLVYFEDLMKEKPDQNEPSDFSASNGVASIIYTSGTTGDPKGVALTNQNFISNIYAATQYVPYNSRDVFLSFLYLSHVLERTGGYLAPLFHGASVYFAESAKTVAEDLKKVKPTILLSVPRVFEKAYDKVMDRVRASSFFKQKLFFSSLEISRMYLKAKRDSSPLKPFFKITHFLADRLVLKKVRQALGGHLKFSISGGAPLNPSVARFIEAIGVKILEGYGLTETSPIISVNPLNGYRFGTVGKVIPGVEVKIAEDKEILVKGHNVMSGYFNNEAGTQEVIQDGWFKTGDLGFLDKDNFLTIIGRKKEMIVTSNGKNVNPNNIENALVENKYIMQAMVYGDKQKHISALVVPDFEQLKLWAEENNLAGEIYELVKQPKVVELYQREITEKLKDFPENEQVKNFILLDREFKEEKEELTPTLKLRRSKILANFKDLLDN